MIRRCGLRNTINVNNFIEKFSSYYDRIQIVAVVLKSNKVDRWYCIRLKIEFLTKSERVIESHFDHLLKNINKNMFRYFNFVAPSDTYKSILDDLKLGRVLLNGIYYEIYSLDTFSENLIFMTLGEIGSHLDETKGFLAIGDSNKGFFPNTIKDLSIDYGALHTNERVLWLLMDIPSPTYFNQHVLILVFPFIKEIKPDIDKKIHKIFEVDKSLYSELKVNFYAKGEDLTDSLEIKLGINKCIIGIPQLDKDQEYYFEIFHPFLSTIIEDTYSKNINDLSFIKTVHSSRKIFIVHGHDTANANRLKIILYELRQNIEPIILQDIVSEGSPTLIDKFEENSDCEYAFILMTPDDHLFQKIKKPGEGNDELYDYLPVIRARQNVIFEYGYFVAKLKRKRVAVIYKKGVDIPSDIIGVEYIGIDASVDEKRYEIQEKLKKASLIE